MFQLLLILKLFLLAFGLFFCLFAFFLSITFFFGAPFVTTPKKIILEIIKLAELTSKDHVIDLGSGDGRIVNETAKICKSAEGFEINPFLFVWSNIVAYVKGVSDNTKFHLQNYLNADLSKASIVTVYGIRGFVPPLERKFKKELKKGTKIVSYKFELSGFQLVNKTRSNIFLYIVI